VVAEFAGRAPGRGNISARRSIRPVASRSVMVAPMFLRLHVTPTRLIGGKGAAAAGVQRQFRTRAVAGPHEALGPRQGYRGLRVGVLNEAKVPSRRWIAPGTRRRSFPHSSPAYSPQRRADVRDWLQQMEFTMSPEAYRHLENQIRKQATVYKPEVTCALDLSKSMFPLSRAPIAEHPIVLKMGPKKQRELQAFLAVLYFHFTDCLEYDEIVPASAMLAQKPHLFGCPPEAGRCARLIVTDESHHSTVNSAVMLDIMDAFGIPLSALESRPRCLVELGRILETVPANLVADARVGFSIASETLVTDFLKDVPQDPAVAEAVRNVVADHAHDEWKHSAFFALVLSDVWNHWSDETKEVIGPLFPAFLRLFVDPDLDALGRALDWIGATPFDARTILRDCYPTAVVDKGAQDAGRATLVHMRRVGVLDRPSCSASFRSHGLLAA
jgi:P-aminobenzoate N-oxygenase AurF